MNITVRKTIAYVGGGIILLNGLLWLLAGLISSTSIVGAGLIIIAGGLALPVARRKLENWRNITLSTPLVVILVIGLFVVGNGWVVASAPPSIAGEGDSSTSGGATQPTGTEASTQPLNHSMGESFQVGGGSKTIEYTVTGTETTSSIGGSFGTDASGVFLIVDLRISNVGQESVDLSSSVFRLVDSQGREYEVDREAMIELEDSVNFEQVNPGLTIEGKVVFDVPENQQGRKLRIDPAGIFSSAESHYVRLD